MVEINTARSTAETVPSGFASHQVQIQCFVTLVCTQCVTEPQSNTVPNQLLNFKVILNLNQLLNLSVLLNSNQLLNFNQLLNLNNGWQVNLTRFTESNDTARIWGASGRAGRGVGWEGGEVTFGCPSPAARVIAVRPLLSAHPTQALACKSTLTTCST